MSPLRTRGLLPEDAQYFAPAALEKLREAQRDLQFLLNRGYPMKSAMTFVGNHHQLTTRQALAVTRATAATERLVQRAQKRLLPPDIAGKSVYIDGFNLIITLEVALSNGMLFIGQDGCLRDLAELRGTYRLIPQSAAAIELIRQALLDIGAAAAIFLLDEPVSNSGRLKTQIYETDWPLPVKVQIVRSPDALLKQLPQVITSDAIILDACQIWFNMAAYMMSQYAPLQTCSRLIDLTIAHRKD